MHEQNSDQHNNDQLNSEETTPREVSGMTPPPLTQGIPLAELPASWFARINYLLIYRDRILESIRQDVGLGVISRTMIVIVAIMGLVYGLVMGGTNLFQGADVSLLDNLLMIVTVALKVPILFLLTLLIVLFPIFVSGTLLGSRISFAQTAAILLTSSAVTVTVLASMATVSFFFALTTQSYTFMKLLHVMFFGYAGVCGISFLSFAYRKVSLDRSLDSQSFVFGLWLILYAFVGTQLAWTLRPFIGAPSMEFSLFRPRSGSFYEELFKILTTMLD